MNNYQNENQAFESLISSLKSLLKDVDVKGIKGTFEKQINSKRTLARIQNCADLLDVLVIQDVICEEYITPLKSLLVPGNSKNLIEKLIYYEKFHILVTNKCCRICGLSLEAAAVPIPEQTSQLSSTVSEEDAELKEYRQAILYLSEKLGGDNWLTLARKLDIPEHQLTNIKGEITNPVERAYQMLWRWREENAEDATVEKICAALCFGQSIRRDLAQDIKKGKHLTFNSSR